MRIAFFPYDILIWLTATILLGIFLRKTLYRNHWFEDRLDRLFPFAVAFIPVSFLFMFFLEEFPVKFFMHDAYYPNEEPDKSPQAPQFDSKRITAAVYNLAIILSCIIIIIRHYYLRKIKRQHDNFNSPTSSAT